MIINTYAQGSPRVAIIGGVVFFAIGAWLCIDYIATRSDFRTTTATVIEIRDNPRYTGDTESLEPLRQSVIAYTANGAEYESEWTYETDMSIGDTVSVSYHPDRPYAPQEASFLMRLLSGLVFVGLGIGMSAIGWYTLKQQG